MHTSLQKLNHFVIVREDNLAPPTVASTTVCLYEFSAAEQVLIALLEQDTFSCFFKAGGCDSCFSAKGEVCVFRMPTYAQLATRASDIGFNEFCRVSYTDFSNCVLVGIGSFQ
jgi:hypothetical protein